jgi:hypothetical protein
MTELRFKRMCKVITSKMLIAAVIGATVLGTFGYAVADTTDTTDTSVSVSFTDVERDYWGYEYINFSAEKQIINGYQQYDGTYIFAPENAVSYEEAATMLYRAISAAGALQSVDDFQAEYETQLTDHVIAEWARPYVAYCLEYGIINQSELAAFTDDAGIGQKAPRLQAALWTAKAMDMKQTSACSVPYSDADMISAEDMPYIDMLYRHGIMKGALQTDGTIAFLPNDGIKRSEFAAISNRVYEAVAMEKEAGASGYYDVSKETASFRGTVTSVDVTNDNIFMIDTSTGVIRRIHLTSGAEINLNGQLIKSGLTDIVSDITGKVVIISSMTGMEEEEINQVNIDTQPASFSGTIKTLEKVSSAVTIVSIELDEGKETTLINYVIDGSTTSTVTIEEGAQVTFIADGVNIVEIV